MQRAMTMKTITASAGAAAYLAHLGAAGKRPSTLATAKRTLALLVAHLGADREVGEVQVAEVEGFLAGEAATRQRGGLRADSSLAQIRRIVRAAFTWWQEQGYVVRGMLPPDAEPAHGKADGAVAACEPEEQAEQEPYGTDRAADILSAASPAPAAPALPAALPAAPPAPAAAPHAASAAPPTPPEPTRGAWLEVTYQGQLARFSRIEIDRARLHGSRKLVALDGEGRECATAQLTRDGRHVLPAGTTADLYLGEDGDAVERRDLTAVGPDGTPLPVLEPTLGVPQEIEGPLPAHILLEYLATRVHALRAEAPAPGLMAALRGGAIFRVQFRPRRTVVETPAFLLGSEAGVFLVQAEPCRFDFVGPEQAMLPDDSADEDEDDLDPFAFPDSFGGMEP